MQALCPPKPNEFDAAKRMFRLARSFGM